MNKSLLRFIFLAMALLTTSAFAGNRAVEISINGIGPAVDGAAMQTVQQVIGHAVADGVIDKFVVNGYGIEGGFFRLCAGVAENQRLCFFCAAVA